MEKRWSNVGLCSAMTATVRLWAQVRWSKWESNRGRLVLGMLYDHKVCVGDSGIVGCYLGVGIPVNVRSYFCG